MDLLGIIPQRIHWVSAFNIMANNPFPHRCRQLGAAKATLLSQYYNTASSLRLDEWTISHDNSVNCFAFDDVFGGGAAFDELHDLTSPP